MRLPTDRGGAKIAGVNARRIGIFGIFVVVAALLAPLARAADDDDGTSRLNVYESKYYLIHTDLPAGEVREARLRMTRMVDEYARRTAEFSGQVTARLPFYLFKNAADYAKAGGVENSAGVFDGQRLMALTLRRDDGVISLATWHVVQHEGFHQFAHAVIGKDLPMWADEGLAEYFGEGLYTGDDFVTGLIPQSRLIRVQKMIVDGRDKPLSDFVAVSREEWNDKIEMANYDQAWSLVHFLAHGEGGRFQKAFTNFMRDVGKGGDARRAYDRCLGVIPNLESRWRDWWLQLPDHPTADEYARATLAMLTSYFARATVRGGPYASFDAFVKTPAARLPQPADDPLPPTLFDMAVNESIKMRQAGAVFQIVARSPTNKTPSLLLTLKDGTKLAGRFDVGDGGRVANVRTEVIVKGTTRPSVTTRPSPPRVRGEMLK